MALIPKRGEPRNSGAIVNSLRNSIGGDYAKNVPVVNSLASLRAAGDAILSQQTRENAFCSTLVNRVIFEWIKVRSYKNPLALFKKGFLEYGETVEEIYVNLIKVRGFDPSQASQRLFQRNIPDVKTAFHSMNIQAEYPVTISEDELRQAFLNFDNLDKFIKGIISRIMDSVNYDEFNLMKKLIGVLALNGNIPVETISTPSASTSNACVTTVKAVSNRFEFMNDKYNMAGVKNFCEKEDQYVLEQSDFNAIVDVNTLASAFNMDKATFSGHIVMFDDLGNVDDERLAELFEASGEQYVPFTDTEKGYLSKIRAILCSRDFFMIWDVLQKMTEAYNGDGLYYNYFMHKWQTLSASPFENVCLFTDQESEVTNVAVDGPATISAVGTYNYDATVTAVAFADRSVTYSVSAGTAANVDKVSIDQFGRLTVATGYATGTVIVKATSNFDGSTNGTKTVTLS